MVLVVLVISVGASPLLPSLWAILSYTVPFVGVGVAGMVAEGRHEEAAGANSTR